MGILYRLLLWLYPERDYASRTGRAWEAFTRFDIHTDGDLYLRRFVLLRTPWGAVYLHHILRSDRDHCLHDHPWRFASLILAGGYYEETDSLGHEKRLLLWYPPGSFRTMPAEHRHRLELADGRPAWSLVFTGPKERPWGFYTRAGWVPWKQFDAEGGEC